MNNPLIQIFQTPFHSAPFEQIKEEHFLPAFKALIDQNEQEIEMIVGNEEVPNFQNTIEALAYAGEQLDQVSNIFFNLNSAETNEALEQIAQEVSPLLTEFSSKILQNQKLFERIKKVYDSQDRSVLTEEQKTLLEETYKGFVRNGALLDDSKKEELKKINIELAKKTLQFGQNVLASTNQYYKHILDKKELEGIPESILQQYQQEAQSRGLEGYVVTLQYPSYIPFMTYAQNRTLREELYLANGKKSFDGGEYDNQNLIKEIVNLRQQKAEILGHENYAEYVLEDRMAKSPIKVLEFLNELLDKATPYAKKDIEALKELALEDGITTIQAFDHAYYAEKLKAKKYNINEEELRPYFRLENVEKAVFGLAEKLFGLTFEQRNDISKYHPEVKVFEVKEEGKHKAILYVDYFPRKGKRAGAWMTSYRNQFKKDGENNRPHISVVCNFSKPTDSAPSLLTFQEVTTLFHEFGHALHGILADTQYPNLSGTSVKWDFVELPSQFLENYCYEIEFLKSFAVHYETGELLSDEKILKISESKNYMEGYQTLRQLGFGLLDMAYHTKASELNDVKEFEDRETNKTTLYPLNPKIVVSTSFSHVFQGGYASGYYSYKWAEVLDADAFMYFKENGIFNSQIAQKYKKLLSLGGTKDPMEIYKEFRGSEPKVESLLKRAFS